MVSAMRIAFAGFFAGFTACGVCGIEVSAAVRGVAGRS